MVVEAALATNDGWLLVGESANNLLTVHLSDAGVASDPRPVYEVLECCWNGPFLAGEGDTFGMYWSQRGNQDPRTYRLFFQPLDASGRRLDGLPPLLLASREEDFYSTIARGEGDWALLLEGDSDPSVTRGRFHCPPVPADEAPPDE